MTVRRVSVTAPGGKTPVEADGEFLGYTPLEMEVLPGAIEFLAPQVAFLVRARKHRIIQKLVIPAQAGMTNK